MPTGEIGLAAQRRRTPGHFRIGIRVLTAAVAAATALAAPAAARAANGTWTNLTSGGLWSDTNNWAGGVVADAQDGTADFSTLNITADNTVNLDTPRTIGNLTFGDATTASNNWVLANNAVAANVLALSTSAGTPTLTVTSQTATISAVLSGTQGFARAGNGTLVLSAANPNLTGTVTVGSGPSAQGSLRITNAAALGGVGGVTLNDTTFAGGTGAQLEMQGGITVNNFPLTMMSNATGNLRGALRSSSGSNTFGGAISVTGSGLAQFYADGGNLTVNGNVTAGAGGFTGTVLFRGATSTGTMNGTINVPNGLVAKTDSGTWTIVNAGNSWGNTQVSVGTFKIGTTNAVPTTTTLTMGQSDTSAATFDLNGKDQTISGLVQSTTGGNKLITNSVAATASTLTINNAAAATYGGTATGPATATIAGNLNLVKNGAGTLTLASANTYTGTTTVTAGTLSVNGGGRLGAATSTADVVVGDAGLLDVQVAAVISDTARLRVTSTDSTPEVSLAAGVNDSIAALVLNGVTFSSPGTTYGSTASGAQNTGLAAAGLNPDDFFSGAGVVTVPEPASAGLVGMAAVGLLARRRRARR